MVLQHPGVVVKEVELGKTPLQGVGTSVTAFFGITRRGKKGEAVLVTSWDDFINKFAYGLETPFQEDSYLAYSVFGFFNNGGTRAYICRITDGSDTAASLTFKDADTEDVIKFEAVDTGSWANDVKIKLEQTGSNLTATISYKNVPVTSYTNISLDPTSVNFAETRINGIDKFIKVEVSKSATITSPGLGSFTSLTGGTNGTGNIVDDNFTNALSLLDNKEDVSIIVTPDSQSENVIDGVLAYCEGRGDCIHLVDGLENATIEEIQEFTETITSNYGAIYYPWIEVSDPLASGPIKTKFIPTAGHVAGVMARIDATRSVYKAPAGIDATVRGAVGIKTEITDKQHGDLNPKGINAIRVFRNVGIVVWGARTFGNQYLNIRRGLNFIKTTFKLGTRWAVFEPNNSQLWRKLTIFAKSFLLVEYGKGGFKGDTPAEAFFVKCDGDINTPEMVQSGNVKMRIGVAIAEPGEFVTIEIGQMDSGATATEI